MPTSRLPAASLSRHVRLPARRAPLTASVDLAAGDVVFAAVERGRFGEAGDRVLARGIGDRIWPRHMRRDRAVVDDPAAHRLLVLHDLEGFLSAQEGTRQDRIDNGFPAIEGELLDRSVGAEAGIVEQHIESPEGLFGLGEQGADRVWVADVGRDTQGLALQALDLADDGLQRLGPAAGDDDRNSISRQRQRRGLANAASPAGDKGDFAVRAHDFGLLLGLSATIPVWAR